MPAAEILTESDLLAKAYEPKRKFRWIVAVDGIDAFAAKTSSRPQMVFDETVIDYINVKTFFAGKATPSPMPITLNDPIAPSAAQKVMEWIRLAFESTTGRMGYASFYKKDLELKLLSPVGEVVEKWTISGAWVQDSNFGELDYSSSDPVEINLILRYDRAVLDF